MKILNYAENNEEEAVREDRAWRVGPIRGGEVRRSHLLLRVRIVIRHNTLQLHHESVICRVLEQCRRDDGVRDERDRADGGDKSKGHHDKDSDELCHINLWSDKNAIEKE